MNQSSTLRTGGDDAARRAYLGVSRGTVVKGDDKPKMQELTIRARFGEPWTNVEHWHPYGFSHVPLPPDKGGEAEVLVAYLSGSPDHPIVIAAADRRHRPKNLKPGESAVHDDQKQHVHLTRGGVNATGKKVTVTAGDKPDTKDHELNEQLKGLAARMAQAEHNLHGLFDVTSRFREIVQGRIPEVAQVAHILNQAPGGLEAMAGAIEGKVQAYLQTQVQQALAKFMAPNLAGLQSLLRGDVEASISVLRARIEALAAGNAAVGHVDDLVAEIAAVMANGEPAVAVAAHVAGLQAEIAKLARANPEVGQVAGLRATLQGLLDLAGPALNFLGPQKRLVQGLTRSMRFGGPG